MQQLVQARAKGNLREGALCKYINLSSREKWGRRPMTQAETTPAPFQVHDFDMTVPFTQGMVVHVGVHGFLQGQGLGTSIIRIRTWFRLLFKLCTYMYDLPVQNTIYLQQNERRQVHPHFRFTTLPETNLKYLGTRRFDYPSYGHCENHLFEIMQEVSAAHALEPIHQFLHTVNTWTRSRQQQHRKSKR